MQVFNYSLYLLRNYWRVPGVDTNVKRINVFLVSIFNWQKMQLFILIYFKQLFGKILMNISYNLRSGWAQIITKRSRLCYKNTDYYKYAIYERQWNFKQWDESIIIHCDNLIQASLVEQSEKETIIFKNYTREIVHKIVCHSASNSWLDNNSRSVFYYRLEIPGDS